MTPIKAIRAFCLDCCGDSANEVKLCPSTKCPLYQYRLGHNPALSQQLTDEQKQALAERLRKYPKNLGKNDSKIVSTDKEV